MPRTLILVRHAETEWTQLGRHTGGHTDLLLTERGEDQARMLAPLLKQWRPETVLVSPLKRAMRTCELTGLMGEATPCELLREWDYGKYEGLTSKQISEIDPQWALFQSGAPGGESLAQIEARTKALCQLIHSLPHHGEVSLFGSGHILRAFATTWLGLPIAVGGLLKLSAPSISILGEERGKAAIASWNLGIELLAN